MGMTPIRVQRLETSFMLKRLVSGGLEHHRRVALGILVIPSRCNIRSTPIHYP